MEWNAAMEWSQNVGEVTVLGELIHRERADCFNFMLLRYIFLCYVSIPRSDMYWSAVCDCGMVKLAF